MPRARGTIDVPRRSTRGTSPPLSLSCCVRHVYVYVHTYVHIYVYSIASIESQTQTARTRRDILRSARGTYITVPAVWVRGRAATFVVYSVYRTGVPYSDSSSSLACTSETGDRAPPRARATLSLAVASGHRGVSRHQRVISRTHTVLPKALIGSVLVSRARFREIRQPGSTAGPHSASARQRRAIS